MNTAPAAAPRAGLGIFALIVGGFAIGTTEFVSMGLLPRIADGVDISIPTAGHVISAYALGVVVGAPAIATLAARAPRRTLLLGLLVLFAIGNAATALAANYPTLLAARFLTGLPHGAFFGVASLVAASLVAPHHRGRAVGRVMLGIPAANLLGVPVTTWLGQTAGWRWTYAALAVIGLAAMVLIVVVIPARPGDPHATGRRELAALRNPALWWTLAAGAFGFGGSFAMFTYITPTLTQVTGLPESAVPIYLFLNGLGGLIGSEVGGRLAERSVSRTVVLAFVLMALVLVAFSVGAPNAIAVGIAFGASAAIASLLVIGLQLQLMNEAGRAETLGAALNHSALNLANALGAWVGGLVVAAGWGYRAPSLVGAGLAVVGLGCIAAYRRVARSRG